MLSKKIAIAITTLGLCTLAAADKNPKIPKIKPAAQHEHQNNSATRSENKADEQRAAQLKNEEEELIHQADAKHAQAKELIQRQKALKGEEVSQERTERSDRKDRPKLAGEVKHESGERAQLNHQIQELDKERAELMRQANEKSRERKAIEAQIHANNSHRK